MRWQVANVIEADARQLLGVYLQAVSLQRFAAPCEHGVVILERDRGDAERIAALAHRLGLQPAVAVPRHENRYLNRWAVWEGFPSLQSAPRLALWDWDIACVAPLDWPEVVDSRVAARRNPLDMYRHIAAPLRNELGPSLVNAVGDVQTSINGGVLLGSGSDLYRVSQRQLELHDLIRGRSGRAAEWELEQLPLSLAVGSLGWERLADSWNVTATSPVADHKVLLWHYNDGHEQTGRMKRHMLSAAIVRDCLARLSERWPQTVARFSALYEESRGASCLRPYLS